MRILGIYLQVLQLDKKMGLKLIEQSQHTAVKTLPRKSRLDVDV